MNKSNNKWLSVIVAFILCLPLYAFTSGDGTYENPYEIAGQSDIVNLIDMVATNNCSGLYFLQTADIDLSPFGNFQGIGGISLDRSTTNAFSGYYDGDGYILTNYYSFLRARPDMGDGEGHRCRGFFNILDNATIQNFTIYGFSTNTVRKGSGATTVRVGGVAGAVRNQTFLENVESYVDIRCSLFQSTNANIVWIGGIAGDFDNKKGLVCRTLVNHGDIRCYSNMGCGYYVGGIFGMVSARAYPASAFYGLINKGNITSKDSAIMNEKSYVSAIATTFGFYACNFYDCENYGDVYIRGNACSANSFFVWQNGSSYIRFYNFNNYGSFTCDFPFSYNAQISVCGGIDGREYVLECYGITNHAPINVSLSSSVQVALNVYVAGCASVYSNYNSNRNNLCNYGDIIVNVSKSLTFLSVGGVVSHTGVSGIELENPKCVSNYGKVFVNYNASDGKIGVAGCVAGSGTFVNYGHTAIVRSAVNFGDVSLNVPTNFVGYASLSGVVSRHSEYQSDTIISNSYNLGKVSWSGKGIEVGGICGDGKTIANANEYVYLRNCYSVGEMEGETEGNFVGSIMGCVSNVLGKVAVSNCFAISKYPAFGAFYGGATNNNVASYTYEQFYRNPNSQAFLYNYAFTQSGRDTNSFYDLALPINKLLFPTITDEIKQKHNWTRLNGYKRYITTIQQQ